MIRKIKQTGDPNTDEVYDSSGTDTFTYKKNKISKVVIKEDSRSEVDTPVYKGKKLNSLKFTSKSPDTTVKGTTKYSYSEVVSQKHVEFIQKMVKK